VLDDNIKDEHNDLLLVEVNYVKWRSLETTGRLSAPSAKISKRFEQLVSHNDPHVRKFEMKC
jgi:predicted acetyltransferase